MSHPTTNKLSELDSDLTPTALSSWQAMALELSVIAVCTLIILVIANISKENYSATELLIIPLAAMAAGVLGVLLAGKQVCGFLFNFRYIAIYCATIGLMIGVDVLVCLWFGEVDLLMIIRNWAILIGSASCINILWHRVFANYLRKKISDTKVDQMDPVILICVILLQFVQMFLSVLGMSWQVALAQIAARRIVCIPLEHIIARLNYGEKAQNIVQSHHTIEHVAVHAMANQSGIVETHANEVTIVGTMLLKLPIFGGKLINFKEKFWMTLVDQMLFLEQKMAFSSPTMVVSSQTALLHVSYSWKGFSKESMAYDPLLSNRMDCKRLLRLFILGKRRQYVAATLNYTPQSVSNNA